MTSTAEALASYPAHYVPEWRRDGEPKLWRSSVRPWRDCAPARQAKLRAAWRRGRLRYKLDPLQREWYDAYRAWESDPNREGDEFALDVSRRVGKTSLMTLIAFEDAIRAESTARLVYMTATEKMAKKIVRPLIAQWLIDCPPELEPRWVASESWYEFPNGAKLELVGMDVDPDRARGTHLDRGYVDEAGFIVKLEYVMTSVIAPMMQGRAGACLLMGSTPPLTPEHYWSSELVPRCRACLAHVYGTIFNNPRLSNAEVVKEITKTGGIRSTAVRRELLAEHVAEETMMVVPEYVDRQALAHVVPPRPQNFNAYVSLDPGWKDCSGLLFGHVNWGAQCLTIEAELVKSQLTSGDIAKQLKAIEADLWGSAKRWDLRTQAYVPQPHRRWTDVDHRLTADLAQDHGLTFSPTAKDNLDQQVVRLREWIQDGLIRFDPAKCPQLHHQLLSAVYQNENRRAFGRSAGHGHFDLVSSLIYLVRNVSPLLKRNPNPPSLWGRDRTGLWTASRDLNDERIRPSRNTAQRLRARSRARRRHQG